MRASLTAVIEQANAYPGDFATEPYETAWAVEARWFVTILELDEGARVSLTPEISPEGLTWCAEGSPSLEFDSTGMQSLALTNFGAWLRLNVSSTGNAKYLIYLSLKG